MTEEKKSHVERVLDVVRGGYSPLGDKTWASESLVRQTGLTDRQVYNAISKIGQFARARGEKPVLHKTDVAGVYVYEGPLKRGRKKAETASPTEEVPFTEEALEDEGQVVAANEAATPRPTIVEGFAKVGEQFADALGQIGAALGTNPPTGPEQAAALQSKALRNNRVTRVIRRMRELADEMGYLENEWEQLAEKGRRYDKLTMTMFGFSSNDPAAVDRLKENGE